MQNLLASVGPPAPFGGLAGTFNSPFLDQEWLGRLDYNVTSNLRLFFKYAFEQNKDVGAYAPGTYSPFANVDYTPSFGGGLDFTTGSFSHAIRIGYMKFATALPTPWPVRTSRTWHPESWSTSATAAPAVPTVRL